jgi:hypothetical protein
MSAEISNPVGEGIAANEKALHPPSVSVPSALELEVYKTLATLFNSEETSFWTRNNILVAVNGVLIAATGAILGNAEKVLASGASPFATILLFAALAGLALVDLCMATAWLFMVGRSERIADTVSGQLKVIEGVFAERVALREEFQAFRTFGRHLTPGQPGELLSPAKWNNDIRLSVLWRRVGWGLAGLWAMLFAIFVVLAIFLRPLPAHSIDANAVALEKVAQSAAIAAQSALRAAEAAEAAASAAKTLSASTPTHSITADEQSVTRKAQP